MYGETQPTYTDRLTVKGLSPHVRGNRAAGDRDRHRAGSIPACTGKPEVSYLCLRMIGVYPRMYGETQAGGSASVPTHGLSPHVRGNQRNRKLFRRRTEVYPRMYGETTP